MVYIKKPIRLHLLIHPIMLGPASTGDMNPGIGMLSSICPWSCFALLCLMTIFQIDLNCIKVFPIIIMCPKKSKAVLVKKRNDFYETSSGKNERQRNTNK
jgi:hypothetical protein